MPQNMMPFANWYRSLPSNRIIWYRDQIIDKCGITQAVFYNWLNGVTAVPKLAQEAIKQIAAEPIQFEDESQPAQPSPHPQD
jgi:hypothetical protein